MLKMESRKIRSDFYSNTFQFRGNIPVFPPPPGAHVRLELHRKNCIGMSINNLKENFDNIGKYIFEFHFQPNLYSASFSVCFSIFRIGQRALLHNTRVI